MQTLTYNTLDRSTQSIRLIDILPGDGPHISCTFHVHQLESNATCPSFTALSYTWGPPDPASEVLITVNGQSFLVRKNLWCALSSYRKKITEGRFRGPLWVDALSINQQDNLERNHQVNMMKVIFSRAETVLVWLGPEEDDSSRLLQYIMTMPSLVLDWSLDQGRPPKYARYNPKQNISTQIVMPRPEFTIDDLFQELFSLQLDQPFGALFRRDYWQRLWIIQEVMLAENLIVLCGDQVCEWSILVSIIAELDYLGQILGRDCLPIDRSSNQTPMVQLQRLQTQVGCSCAYNILIKGSDSDRLQKRKEGSEFRELVQTWLHQECTDPRDRVYGLLGLVKGETTADYGKTVDEVYCNVLASEGPKISDDQWLVFVNALTNALYKDPSPEKVKELGLISGVDVEYALSFFCDFRVLPAWPSPSEQERLAEPPIISYFDSTGQLYDFPDPD
ncbi:Heterokaryon incompatibility protein [Hyphodiscus hymeniophilus]|uniref:Heterokaryon incompatibility protein n=1 Tax=Hyphodiscus hymeniophilus TaxID=353542 RepID=A0A9P6VMZ9_9HELO|nr:Heterokaryon incompatibility protein [Hyphodiscus hymeniophilus]